MENGLPENIEDLRAEVEFYTQLKTMCDAIRTGPREELSPVAAKESLRCKERLHKLGLKLARLEKKAE